MRFAADNLDPFLRNDRHHRDAPMARLHAIRSRDVHQARGATARQREPEEQQRRD